eukprot:TRINITY_DN1795_c0_g1_i1.p1 TRINITY_DN1795_c0_g1~~TRINITY_DN1795_c0_g1_i1.p1  ORF type:complete len:468 (-),score=76.03 TRINITY_DN1795_c0_g1_i1:112-1515(-)
MVIISMVRLFVLSFLAFAALCSALNNWRRFGNDLTVSRLASVSLPADHAPHVLWDTHGHCDVLSGLHAYTYELVFTDDEHIIALKQNTSDIHEPVLESYVVVYSFSKTGQHEWHMSLHNPKSVYTTYRSAALVYRVGSNATTAREFVYVADTGCRSTALDARTGNLVWQKEFNLSCILSKDHEANDGSDFALAGVLYWPGLIPSHIDALLLQSGVIDDDHPVHTVAGLDPLTGAIRRFFPPPLIGFQFPPVLLSCAKSDFDVGCSTDLLFVSTPTSVGAYYIINASLAWENPLVAVRSPMSLFVKTNPQTQMRTEYVLVDSFGLLCLNARTGAKVWYLDTDVIGYNEKGDMAIDSERGMVYIARQMSDSMNRTTVMGIDVLNGTVRWSTTLPEMMIAETPLTLLKTMPPTNNRVLLVSLGWQTQALDASNGKALWSIWAGSYSTSFSVGSFGFAFCNQDHGLTAYGF